MTPDVERVFHEVVDLTGSARERYFETHSVSLDFGLLVLSSMHRARRI
jgi:hypothetical protein